MVKKKIFIILLSLFVNSALLADSEEIERDYGRLEIKSTETIRGIADFKPWSSWWYPLFEDTLFNDQGGKDSPLRKYDSYVTKVSGQNPGAQELERVAFYEPRATAWSGLCDAWAFASILHNEPTQNVIRNGIEFEVMDQKALLLKLYDGVNGERDLKHYGKRNRNNWDDVYSDIKPHHFMKFVIEEIVVRKRPFIMDYDAGIEVWNVPVYQVSIDIQEQDSKTLVVEMHLSYASPHVDDYNYVGTLATTKSYKFLLHHKRGKVSDSEWIEDSRWDHPDYLITYPHNLKPAPLNNKIKPIYVKQIIEG